MEGMGCSRVNGKEERGHHGTEKKQQHSWQGQWFGLKHDDYKRMEFIYVEMKTFKNHLLNHQLLEHRDKRPASPFLFIFSSMATKALRWEEIVHAHIDGGQPGTNP